MMKTCRTKGCSREAIARGLCMKHYDRRRRAGKLTNVRHPIRREDRERFLAHGRIKCTCCGIVRHANKFSPSGVRVGKYRCKACERAAARFRICGVTQDHVRRMWRAQSARCAICNRKLESMTHCHVDHNHMTGQIRGLLCSRCNRAIGWMEDSAALLYSAAKYLDDAELRMNKERKESDA